MVANEYLENLKQKQINAKKAKDEAVKARSNSILGSLVVFAIVVIISVSLLFTVTGSTIGNVFFYISLAMTCTMLLIVLFIIFDYKPIKQAQTYIDLVNDEMELYEVRNEDERILADKQFKIHQKELKRYYDLNLSQIKFLSILGIILIISGVGIVIGCIVMYLLLENDIWFLAVGIISGVLFDCIGAFFISMYTENMKIAISLHAKLAGSNNLLLANLIVAKISNGELRDSSLAEISKNISTNIKD